MRTPPPKMTCGFLIQLVFCKKTMWFIGVEVEQETSAPPPKKKPGSAPDRMSVVEGSARAKHEKKDRLQTCHTACILLLFLSNEIILAQRKMSSL